MSECDPLQSAHMVRGSRKYQGQVHFTHFSLLWSEDDRIIQVGTWLQQVIKASLLLKIRVTMRSDQVAQSFTSSSLENLQWWRLYNVSEQPFPMLDSVFTMRTVNLNITCYFLLPNMNHSPLQLNGIRHFQLKEETWKLFFSSNMQTLETMAISLVMHHVSSYVNNWDAHPPWRRPVLILSCAQVVSLQGMD